jgi:hypothetical protein
LFRVESDCPEKNAADGRQQRHARKTRRVEHYWLCDQCAPYLSLTFDSRTGVLTVPLPEGRGEKTVQMVQVDPVALHWEDQVAAQVEAVEP